MEVEVVDWKKWMDIRGLKIWMDGGGSCGVDGVGGLLFFNSTW